MRLKVWVGRLAGIPLAVYALGVPLMLYHYQTITIMADRWLPFEIVGLTACAIIFMWGTTE